MKVFGLGSGGPDSGFRKRLVMGDGSLGIGERQRWGPGSGFRGPGKSKANGNVKTVADGVRRPPVACHRVNQFGELACKCRFEKTPAVLRRR